MQLLLCSHITKEIDFDNAAFLFYLLLISRCMSPSLLSLLLRSVLEVVGDSWNQSPLLSPPFKRNKSQHKRSIILCSVLSTVMIAVVKENLFHHNLLFICLWSKLSCFAHHWLNFSQSRLHYQCQKVYCIVIMINDIIGFYFSTLRLWALIVWLLGVFLNKHYIFHLTVDLYSLWWQYDDL